MASKSFLTKAYLAYFGRPVDVTGMATWSAESVTETFVQNAFFLSNESQALYGSEFSAATVNAIYNNLFGRDAEPDGIAYWLNKVLTTKEYTPAGAALAILEGAANADKIAVDNKLVASEGFTTSLDTSAEMVGYAGAEAAAAARFFLAGVTVTPATQAQIDAGVHAATTRDASAGGESFRLTTGADYGNGFTGSISDDIYTSNVEQNMLGGQVNTLGSGDDLNGGAGTDTLNAKITAGAFVDGSGSYSMPIQPQTTSVEIVNLEAVEAGIGYGFDPFDHDVVNNTQVYVNAKEMVGVTHLSSLHSDADLTILNLTTQGLNKLSDMTVGMKYSGNADTHWGASDLTVYFDQDYLTPEATRTSPVVDILAMNEDAYDETLGDLPLAGVFFRELTITVNGVRYDLTPYMGESATSNGEEISTYAQLLEHVQSALTALKAANPADAALQTVQAELGPEFRTDVDPVTLTQRVGTSIRLTMDGLTNGTENSLVVEKTDLEVARASAASYENNNRIERVDSDPAVEGARLAINVDLEKVGLAGDGGELIIGSMNKHVGNVWDAVNTVTDTTSGIEEFNVTVYGANDKSSSLAGLHSTNNNLRVVTVKTDASLTGTSFADLTIGNSNTDGDLSSVPSLDNQSALKDVQTFDAANFKGDLHLYAALTSEVTAKYFALDDQAPDAPTVDNVAFEYTGGTGDDVFNIALDVSNEAFAGTVTREDFVMTTTVDGGKGNDTITLAMVNSETLADGSPVRENEGYLANWYDNQKLLNNVRINGGEGDDTIWTPGSGDVIIDGGANNDTVYADNTGDMATWVFNAADDGANADARRDIDNIQSSKNNSYHLFKTDVVVNFLGFEVKVAVVDKMGVATDLDINQAIKKAINVDPVLSKLLVAADGPANTLIIKSLIDGTVVSDDLQVSLEAPLASELTAGDVANLATWYATPGLTAASAATHIAAAATVFNVDATQVGDTNGTYNQDFARDGGAGSPPSGGHDLVGDISIHVSDNHITGGTGNDVMVLGTGVLSNDTVVYAGYGNGDDTIVHFVAGDEIVEIQNTAHVSGIVQGADAAAAITAVQEVFSLQLTGTVGATPGAITLESTYLGYTAGDLAVTPAVGDSAATLAAAIIAANNAEAGHTFTASAGATADTVVFTQITGAAIADPTVSNAVTTDTIRYDGSGVGLHVVETANGVTAAAAGTATAEVVTVTFGAGDVAGSVSFGGVTVPVLAGESGANIAAAFEAASASLVGWTATNADDTSVVVFTSTAPGSIADVTDASFVGANIEAITFGIPAGHDIIDFSAYGAKEVFVGAAVVTGVAALAGQDYIVMTEDPLNAGKYEAKVYTEAGATDTLVGVIGTMDFGAHQDFVAANFVI